MDHEVELLDRGARDGHAWLAWRAGGQTARFDGHVPTMTARMSGTANGTELVLYFSLHRSDEGEWFTLLANESYQRLIALGHQAIAATPWPFKSEHRSRLAGLLASGPTWQRLVQEHEEAFESLLEAEWRRLHAPGDS